MVQRSGIDTIKYHTWPRMGKWGQSAEVSFFPVGDHKAHINRHAHRHTKQQTKNIKDPQKKSCDKINNRQIQTSYMKHSKWDDLNYIIDDHILHCNFFSMKEVKGQFVHWMAHILCISMLLLMAVGLNHKNTFVAVFKYQDKSQLNLDSTHLITSE